MVVPHGIASCLAVWLCTVSFLLGGGAAAPDASAAKVQEELAQAVLVAASEEDARSLLEPYMENLKDLDQRVVENVVLKQWWSVAKDIVAKSHLQKVDMSGTVRRAVRLLREEGDELLRRLNPKYGTAQQVSPAFQWAQNDTSIFLTIKYTVRWNAPGALEIKEPSVNITKDRFNFSGLGKHSNNLYKYFLSLSPWDELVPAACTWSAASVGKLSVTLRKRGERKWPRLLANKKTKISNMHVWMENQQRLDASLTGMSKANESPLSCRLQGKFFCSSSDYCLDPDRCSDCKGKDKPNLEEHICAGLPSTSAEIQFVDQDRRFGHIGGKVSIFKAQEEEDIDSYDVYFGVEPDQKLVYEDGTEAKIRSVKPTGNTITVTIPIGTRLPEKAKYLLVYSVNTYGERSIPGGHQIKDAALPHMKPKYVKFEDEDGDKGQISGTVTIGKPDDETHLTEIHLHWGKSEKRKLAHSPPPIISLTTSPGHESVLSHYIELDTEIPQFATHLLAYSANNEGELPFPTSIRLVDGMRACTERTDDNCPGGVKVLRNGDREAVDAGEAHTSVVIMPAKNEKGLWKYSLYWGKWGCGEKFAKPKEAKIDRIASFTAGKNRKLQHDFAKSMDAPQKATHFLVFVSDRFGESENCVSVPLSAVETMEKSKKKKEEQGFDDDLKEIQDLTADMMKLMENIDTGVPPDPTQSEEDIRKTLREIAEL